MDEPVTLPSIYRRGNCKGKVNLITKPGWHQVVVQLGTNSWRQNVQCWLAQPKPILPDPKTKQEGKVKCWTNWCC